MNSKKSDNNRNLTMRGISLPDQKKIKHLSDPKFRGSGANRTAEDIFEGNKFRNRGSFEKAIGHYNDNEFALKKKAEEEAKEKEHANFEDFEDSFIKKQRELSKNRKGKLSRMRKNAIISSVSALCVLLFFLFFFPPVMSCQPEYSYVIYNDEIFEKMGLEEYKAYSQANYTVYNEKAFSSERMENYRTVILCFKIHNLSPFEIDIPAYKIISADPLYQDKICYVGNMDNDTESDTVAPFGEQDVTVKVLVNVTDMNDDQFTGAVDSLVISTKGMRKNLGSIKIHSIPSTVFVSDDINVTVNHKSAFSLNSK